MRELSRRELLRLIACVATAQISTRHAEAQAYPFRPVRIVVGFPAGSAPDIVVRLVGHGLSERLGQPVVIENRPGAGSNIGVEAVVRAPADGYTLLLVALTNVINTTLYPNLKFNLAQDIAPVASIGGNDFVMVINPSVPANTLSEFVAYAKANPNKLNMASGGIGTIGHIMGELFKTMAGVDFAHVPYRGNYMPDLLGGQVQVAFSPIWPVIESVRSGKLRALAVTGARRSDVLPDIPTVREILPGYEAIGWLGIGALANTPSDILDKLNREITAVVVSPDVKAHLVGMGIEPMAMTRSEFGKLIADETEKWGKVIRAANIGPE